MIIFFEVTVLFETFIDQILGKKLILKHVLNMVPEKFRNSLLKWAEILILRHTLDKICLTSI